MEKPHSTKISLDDIEHYFSPSVWNTMGDYEKSSYRNIVDNYNIMLDLGFKPRKPYFMESAKPQFGLKRSSSSRETCPSQPKQRCLLPPEDLPHTVTSSMYQDEEEPFQNINFELFSPKEKQRAIKLSSMFTAVLDVYNEQRRGGRVAWLAKLYRMPGMYRRVNRLVRRNVPVGLEKPDLTSIEPDENTVEAAQPNDKQKPDEKTVAEPQPEDKEQREQKKLRDLIRKHQAKKQFRSVQTQTCSSGKLLSPQTEIWASLVFTQPAPPELKKETSPTTTASTPNVVKKPADPEARRKLIQKMEKFLETNWKSIETQTESTDNFNADSKLKKVKNADVFDTEGDEFEFLSLLESAHAGEDNKITPVKDKEEVKTKIYKNEGDEFEFPAWSETDDTEEMEARARRKLEEEFNTFDFGYSQETIKEKLTQEPLRQTEDDEIKDGFTPKEQKISDKKITSTKSLPDKDFDTFDFGDSQETNKGKLIMKSLPQTEDDGIHDFGFTPEEQKGDRKTETMSKLDEDLDKCDNGNSQESKENLPVSETEDDEYEDFDFNPEKQTGGKQTTKLVKQKGLRINKQVAKKVKSKKPKPLQLKEKTKPLDQHKSPEDKVSRYPRRNVGKVDYKEEEDLQDDDFIFCDLCDHEHLGDCPVHGPHKHFVDTFTTIDGDENRAEKTAPAMLKVATSQIPMAGLGVWTDHGLPGYVRLGPYQGKKSKNPDGLGYSWTIKKNKKADHYVAAGSSSYSNWMRFVNCARHESEQNLMAFQYKGELFYRTAKPIPPKVELMVWYGKEYAAQLGISLESFRSKDTSHLISLVFPCEKCDKTYSSPLYLDSHSKMCRGFKKALVRVKAEEMSEDVQNIAKIIDGKKVYHCEYCEYTTKYSGNMKSHLATHTGVKAYMCDVCEKRFTQEGHLTVHKRIHTGEKPFKCTECEYSSNHYSALKIHMAKHSGEQIFACKFCKYKTNKSSDLTYHMRTHTGDKPYMCEQCQYKSAQSSALKRHIRDVHTDNKPYMCEQCQYKSAQSSHMKTHIRAVHTDNKPYMCEHCQYKTAQSGDLKKHILAVHTDNKPYMCEQCQYKSADSGNLKKHIRAVHTDNKPYMCEHCQYKTAVKSNLTQHMKNKHSDKTT